MAFCTTCGASVQGPFCVQCGTPVTSSGQGAPPPGPAAPVPTPTPASYQASGAPPAPSKRKMSPLVIVLIVIGGLFVVGGIAVVGGGLFLVHKAKQAGFDPALAERNPAYAAAKMIVSMNPDLEEVSHDEDSGTITVREKSTGKTTTLRFNDLKDGKLSFSATDEEGKTATFEAGSAAGKLPSWVPVYPGAQTEGSFSMKADSADGTGGTVTYQTPDSVSQVLAFYRGKASENGMEVKMDNAAGEGATLVMGDSADSRTLSVILGRTSGRTSIHLTYGDKE